MVKLNQEKVDLSKYFHQHVRHNLYVTQDAPKPNTHMPFGIGRHVCPGNQLAKLEMLVFLHHLTTHFRYAIH